MWHLVRKWDGETDGQWLGKLIATVKKHKKKHTRDSFGNGETRTEKHVLGLFVSV